MKRHGAGLKSGGPPCAAIAGGFRLRQPVRKIRRSHDALANTLSAYEREYRLYDVRRIEHLVVSEPLCRQEASTMPVAGLQLAVTPGYFVVIEIVHDQTGLS